MLNEPGREARAAAVGDWPDPVLPESAGDQRRIAATLVLLAVAGFVALVASLLPV